MYTQLLYLMLATLILKAVFHCYVINVNYIKLDLKLTDAFFIYVCQIHLFSNESCYFFTL